MMRALWSAASGMIAQQTNMDIVAHNLANVNTYGNKKVRAEFQDLLYQTLRDAGGNSSAQNTTYPQGKQVGLGVRVAATHRVFVQGPLETTDVPTDVGIQGDGFFRITLPNGDFAYTRDGSFKLSSDGIFVTTDGYHLSDEITIPPEVSRDSIVIAQDGTVSYTQNGQAVQAGTITIYRFVNPEGLASLGKNLFRETTASGTATQVEFTTQGEASSLAQGTLEMSGVQVVEEMVNMIIAQRAYESNSKAITTSDSMLEIANQLKR